MEYIILKLLHMLFATISISAFSYRGMLAIRQPGRQQQGWLRVVPHINDTLLLVTAILLVIQTGYNPLQQTWLATKITLLIVYIALGLVTLRFAKNKMTRIISYSLAIATFLWIIAIAVSKSPLVFA